jgi:hypothetical protein
LIGRWYVRRYLTWLQCEGLGVVAILLVVELVEVVMLEMLEVAELVLMGNPVTLGTALGPDPI